MIDDVGARHALGRKIVFSRGDVVVKVDPRFRAADILPATAALNFVHGRLR
jgi:hypothetical protein